MDKRLKIIFLGIGVFLLFIFFSFLVHKNLFIHVDFNTTVRLQDHMSRRFDLPFSILSIIGNFEVVSVILLIILAIRRKLNGILVLFFFVVFHLFEVYGKTFVSHLPPPQFLLRTQNLSVFPQFYVRLENSYPSGHLARALFLTTVLFFMTTTSKRLSKNQKIVVTCLLVLYDIIMGISRVYLGEHWFSDVIGGSLLGLSFGIFSGIVFFQSKKLPTKLRSK